MLWTRVAWTVTGHHGWGWYVSWISMHLWKFLYLFFISMATGLCCNFSCLACTLLFPLVLIWLKYWCCMLLSNSVTTCYVCVFHPSTHPFLPAISEGGLTFFLTPLVRSQCAGMFVCCFGWSTLPEPPEGLWHLIFYSILQFLKRMGAAWCLEPLQSITTPRMNRGRCSTSTKLGGTLLSSVLSCIV